MFSNSGRQPSSVLPVKILLFSYVIFLLKAYITKLLCAYYVPNTVKLVSFPHPALLHNIVQNVRCTNLRVAFPIMNTPIIVHILIYAALHTHSAPRIRSVF